jgi:Holliday junction resolvase RusA-like endonuclease
MSNAWTFTIPGPPVAKQRPRRNGETGVWYTPRQTIEAEVAVAWCARSAGVKLEPDRLYAVAIVFHLSSHRKDVDNLTKTVLDGLQRMGQEWNDRQVVSLTASKVMTTEAALEQTTVSISDRGSAPRCAKERKGDQRGLGPA